MDNDQSCRAGGTPPPSGSGEPREERATRGAQSSAVGDSAQQMHIDIRWVHDTRADLIYQDFEYIPFLDRMCKTTRAPLEITGDLVGTALMLSDVACWTKHKEHGQVYAVLAYDTVFAKTGEAVVMLGHMDLQLDGTAPLPTMEGQQTFRDGVGTHHGILYVKGVVRSDDDGALIGVGTATGKIVRNL